MRSKPTTKATAKDAIKLLHEQGSLLYEECYTEESDDESDNVAEAQTLIFKNRNARAIFEEMPIQLQHMIIKTQDRRRIRMADVATLCRNENFKRKFTASEEKHFRGYTLVTEMLEEFGIDTQRVSI